ncbi:MAG: phosphatidylinositol-specific phospholipase C/glycerophosphodiester phosphodiesterase family protein [Planctomycetales bacterium]|nr:phosphatidylinositol-specific phospholipase C/glycerophosphodiester phosphodiesterase family protein [Planctomycetales bacterium]
MGPLKNAHAHNDYHHDRPLMDALDHGFTSVEADIFLVDGKLLVAHSRLELKPASTLASLYLNPLQERIRAQGGRVYRDGPLFTLLVDIKSEGESTYRALHEVLRQYPDMLTAVHNGQVRDGPVQIIISGNRPHEFIAQQSERFAAVDGRISDLDSTAPAHLLPLISDNWRNHFRWSGTGPMPSEELAKLQDIITRAHQAGRRVRFWATPENAAVWDVLYQQKVDLVNTDKLAELEAFLRSKE